ncbi:hypothetical protein FKM82_011894 [Ascaphus truei]
MAKEISMDSEEADPQQSPYMLFLLVIVFFITGLVGILICHILKKKGYRCRTSPEDLDPESKEGLSEENTEEISNEDTVERIVKCIIQNEANAEALKQMLGDTEGEVPAVPDAGPPHHHTVHLGSTHAPCIHCTRKKRSLLHRMGRSKDSRGKIHPGEVTVFSVGRFRVTHIGKKSSLQGSQDDPDASTEPISSEKYHEEQQVTNPQNGLVPQEGNKHGTEGLPQNGPEEVGLAKLERQGDAGIKSVYITGPRKLVNKAPGNSIKSKGSKDRRCSAPEQTAEQRERVDICEMKGGEQHKGKTYVAEDKSVKKVMYVLPTL